MTIVTIVGARPQLVKAAMTSRAFAARGLPEVIVHTGQHYDHAMSAVFFADLGIPAERHNLGVGSGPHGVQTARMLERIEAVLLQEAPAAVLVFGDTNSTLAGALAAAKLHIPIGHVEAGMRSFNRRMPEELNRVVTDHLATWHYCATETARRNLAAEGVREGVVVVGDVMADAVELFAARVADHDNPARALGLEPGAYAVMTCHRAENTDDPVRLEGILAGVGALARHLPVVYPVHPRTRTRLTGTAAAIPSGVHLIDPVGYPQMIALARDAALVLTDSGGLQKEAYLLGRPCVTLRDETEWVETVAAGWNQLAGTDPVRIEVAARAFLAEGGPPLRPELFGDGHAAERISAHLAGVAG